MASANTHSQVFLSTTFAFASFLSAALLFSIEPIFAKMILPFYGGAPSVWNTAVVFFQAVLLIGYLTAHLFVRYLPTRAQIISWFAVFFVATVALPLTASAEWAPSNFEVPVGPLLLTMIVTVAVPFMALSITAPLLQSWFAKTKHAGASDPYFLYGAGNFGGLLALLSYPILIEPNLGLIEQNQIWTFTYWTLIATIALCALPIWRSKISASNTNVMGRPSRLVGQVSWRLRFQWIVFSFAPAALFLGATFHISTNVAAVPFLWVVPLAIYLLSFVLVFSRRPPIPHKWMVVSLPIVLILLTVNFWSDDFWRLLFLHLAAVFVGAMVCHGELRNRRPVSGHLTEFYLWIAIGGLLGGIFNSILVSRTRFPWTQNWLNRSVQGGPEHDR